MSCPSATCMSEVQSTSKYDFDPNSRYLQSAINFKSSSDNREEVFRILYTSNEVELLKV